MRLIDLTAKLPILRVNGDQNIEISGLAKDSRLVAPGNLFICVKGAKEDGHRYLEQAAAAGAVAAVVEDWPEFDWGLTLIQVPQVALLLKEIAGRFHDFPERKLQLIGVVGTNGKTTSTYLIKSILESAGYPVGLIGTITNLIKNQPLEAHNTTPGALELQELLGQMVVAGVKYVVMEVSSHSIDQGRVAGLSFRSGLFTNITQDHLDYHKTFEAYLNVKRKFFRDLPNTSWAAINRDDPHADHFISTTAAKVITYGIKGAAEVRAEAIRLTPFGVDFQAITPLGSIDLKLKLSGDFNIYNALGALAVGISLGLTLDVIRQGLEMVTGIPGRFEMVPGASEFGVIVDYAHTPDGLENILKTGRALTNKRLLLAFGCGGDRDRTKRPIMGAIAAKMADLTIITSDNPRSEEPRTIINEIEIGFKKANPSAAYHIEPDREAAIHQLIAQAQPGDSGLNRR